MGIDIARGLDPPLPIDGAAIVAAAGGTVSAAASLHPTMGNMLEIDHGGGWVSRYMHNRQNLAALGQAVRQGETVALVGSTGRSTGPHLHFELLRLGAHVDPLRYLGPAAPLPAAPAPVAARPRPLLQRVLGRLFAGPLAAR